VCAFVQGLSEEFGDQASVYAAAMKEKAIDGEALLDLSAANPIAGSKLKELGLKIGHRTKLQRLIKELQTQNLPRTRSTAPGGGGPRSLSRCTAPSAHPPQVMLRGWEYDCLFLSLPAPLACSGAHSFPPSLFHTHSFTLSFSACVFLKRVVISERQSVSCRAC